MKSRARATGTADGGVSSWRGAGSGARPRRHEASLNAPTTDPAAAPQRRTLRLDHGVLTINVGMGVLLVRAHSTSKRGDAPSVQLPKKQQFEPVSVTTATGAFPAPALRRRRHSIG